MKKWLSLFILVLFVSQAFAGVALAQTTTAGAKGYGGEVTVEVTVEDGVIVSVTADVSTETPALGGLAAEKLPAMIVEAQSVAIDGVSGATVTSTALLAAAKEALLAAGLSEADITKVPEADATAKETSYLSADVVVVGAGGAGMSAAVEALKGGSTVIVIDKMPTLGGNTRYAGSSFNAAIQERVLEQVMPENQMIMIKDMLALEPHDEYVAEWQKTLQAEIDAYEAANSTYLFDSVTLHKLQTYIGGDYVANPVLVNQLSENAPWGFEFLKDLGAVWNVTVGSVVGSMWNRSQYPDPTAKWGAGGAAFVLPQIEYAQSNGATLLVEHEATELIVKDGRIAGVKGITSDGTPFEFSASKGVVMATGGFSANIEMRQHYNTMWETLDETILTTNLPSSMGDGIVMSEAVGASLIDMEWIQMVPADVPGKSITGNIENCIFINNDGLRFINEDGRRDELSKAIMTQGVGNAWRMYDGHTITDLLGGKNTYTGADIEEMIDNQYVFASDTVEGLAEQMGIDPAVLVATVNNYNEHVASGKTDDLGRNLFVNPLNKAPYYVAACIAMCHHTMGGLEINENCQVLDTEGNVIPGFYAAGEVTGGIHGANRLGGNAIADIIVHGRIAGQNIAEEN